MCGSSVWVCIKYDRLSPAISAQDDKQSEDQVVSCDEEATHERDERKMLR